MNLILSTEIEKEIEIVLNYAIKIPVIQNIERDENIIFKLL